MNLTTVKEALEIILNNSKNFGCIVGSHHKKPIESYHKECRLFISFVNPEISSNHSTFDLAIHDIQKMHL